LTAAVVLRLRRSAGFGLRAMNSPLIQGDDPKVVFLGDSVLDNFFWLRDRSTDLRQVLDQQLREEENLRGYRCVNLAIDQMSSFDLLRRDPFLNPWIHYDRARRRVFENSSESSDKTYEHLVATDGNIYSAKNVQCLKNVRCAVLSVGGNDVYLNSDVQLSLVKSLVPGFRHLREEVASDFRSRLDGIFESLDYALPADTVRLPVIVYHPHHSFSISGLEGMCSGLIARTLQRGSLRHLVTPMARQILWLAQERCLPVLDLSRTFDPNDVRHYGTMDMDSTEPICWSGAEPSDISQVFISELIVHVLNNWTPQRGSVVYWGVPEGRHLEVVMEDRNVSDYPSRYVFGEGASKKCLFGVCLPED